MKYIRYVFVIIVILSFPSLSSADYSQTSFTGYYSVNSQQAVTYGYNGPLWQAFGPLFPAGTSPAG